jgi:hypothetical protein
MIKHTPGPLVVKGTQDRGSNGASVEGIYGVPVAWFGTSDVYGKDGTHRISPEEALANATLFSAAPSMLEALELIANTRCDAQAVAIAAIAKATGDAK